MGIAEPRADGSGDFEGQLPGGHMPTTRAFGAGRPGDDRQKTDGVFKAVMTEQRLTRS
jgi:hypothetical protein